MENDYEGIKHVYDNMKNVWDKEADEIAGKVRSAIRSYAIRTHDALVKAYRDKQEIIREVKNEYEDENRELRQQLALSVATLASQRELESWYTFIDKHEACRLGNKYDGGKLPYITQFGTGIGMITKAHCQVCGAVEDITDESVW